LQSNFTRAVAQLPPPITAILLAVFIAAKIEKIDGIDRFRTN